MNPGDSAARTPAVFVCPAAIYQGRAAIAAAVTWKLRQLRLAAALVARVC